MTLDEIFRRLFCLHSGYSHVTVFNTIRHKNRRPWRTQKLTATTLIEWDHRYTYLLDDDIIALCNIVLSSLLKKLAAGPVSCLANINIARVRNNEENASYWSLSMSSDGRRTGFIRNNVGVFLNQTDLITHVNRLYFCWKLHYIKKELVSLLISLYLKILVNANRFL